MSQKEIIVITEEMMNEARDRLVLARTTLLLRHGFFGQLALRLQFEPANPKWCPTAATDGRKFYYNPAFVTRLDNKELVFLVAHELGHCIYEHFMRRDGREPRMWNIAGDYVINNMIDNEIVKKGDYARVITTVTPFLDHKYDEWTTEEVYDDLEQQANNGKDLSKDGELVDVHIDFNSGGSDDQTNEQNGPGQGGGSDDPNADKGLADTPDSLNEDQQKELSNTWRDAVVQAAQQADAGSVPAGIKRMITSLTDPKMDWRELLRAQVESSLRSNFSWMRPNRKGWHCAAVLPGMDRGMKIDVAICIDTSGSISNTMLRDFLSEVNGIMEQYDDYRIRIWQFDTKVYGYAEFTADNGDELLDYQIKGGGGTNFMANWEFMKDNDIAPDQLVMFTDGYPYGSWGDPDYCDTLFVIHSNGSKKITAPFGVSVHYE